MRFEGGSMNDDVIPGLLWGYRFDATGRGRRLVIGEVDGLDGMAEGWTWLHFNLANARAREWLGRAPMSRRAREVLLDDEEIPTLIGVDSVGVGVLADLKREFDHSTEEIARLRFAVTDRLVITCRRHPLNAIEAVHQAVEKGEAFTGPADIIGAILERFGRSVASLVREHNHELDAIEDRVILADDPDQSERLARVRRTALRLHRQMLGQCNLLSTAVDEEERSLPRTLFEVIERAERRARALDRDIETVQERARALQDDVAAKATVVTNRNLFALSILTALFLPATLVTGLFGMNADGLPWEENTPYGFWYATALAAAGSASVYLLLRRLGVTRH
jgi:zinc transporter